VEQSFKDDWNIGKFAFKHADVPVLFGRLIAYSTKENRKPKPRKECIARKESETAPTNFLDHGVIR